MAYYPRCSDGQACAAWLRIAALGAVLAILPPEARSQDNRAPHALSESEAGNSSGLPMRPARTARFRTSEGTWMSVDVSPDGKSIVFDLLGDLYVIPMAGGRAVQVTSGMTFNQQPRYSPDGRQLAFISDRGGNPNLWIADRDGQNARQISQLRGGWDVAVSSPAWSPNGETIVVSQLREATRPVRPSAVDRMWLLAAYDITTLRMRWISDTTPDGAAAALGPAVAQDGRSVYAAVDVSKASPPRGQAPFFWRVVRVDMQTHRVVPDMWRNVGRVGMRPAVSPDGRYLAYASSSGSHGGIRVRDLHSFQERWLVREVLDDPPIFPDIDPRDIAPGYAFTHDSKALVIAYGGHIRRIEISSGRATIIPFLVDVARPMGAMTLHQFTLPDSGARTHSVMQPALSPDGAMVAFSAIGRIWVMRLRQDGLTIGMPYRLTTDSVGEFFPSWSPDGRWLAYSVWQDGIGGGVRRAKVSQTDGLPGTSEQLTADSALYFHTAVAPDGKRVVAVRVPRPADPARATDLDPLAATLVWMLSSGGLTHTITSLAAVQSAYRSPVDQVYFTADGSRIYVGPQSWTWDGTPQPPAFVVAGEEDPEAADVGAVLSPDGQRALVSYRRTLFEIMLGTSGRSYTHGTDTLRFDRWQSTGFDHRSSAVRRWGTALQPSVSWSRDGQHVVFSQGGTLFRGTASLGRWTTFTRIDVPLPMPVDVPHGTIVLRGARVITMRKDEVLERADLLVRNNRIAGVGPSGTLAIPDGADVLDLSGKTILPGYVDLHNHLELPKGIHPTQCWQCLLTLAFGVTVARDPQPNDGNDIFTYGERERTGDLLAPRIFTTGVPYYGTEPPIQTLADAEDVVRPNAEYFRSETFKVYADQLVGRRARQLLATALAEAGLNGTVHTHAIGFAVTVALDGLSGLEHAPGTSRLYDDVARLIAESGVTHTQTYGVYGGYTLLYYRFGWPRDWPKWRRFAPPSIIATECNGSCSVSWYGPPEWDHLITMVSGAARIVRYGGRVGIGSHGMSPGLGFHYELWLHALGGMSNRQILQAATIAGATAIGHARDLGSLEVGKLADLQVLNRNPLDEIHNSASVQYVMKNGRLYDAGNLTEIWPRHRPLNALYLRVEEQSPAVTSSHALPSSDAPQVER